MSGEVARAWRVLEAGTRVGLFKEQDSGESGPTACFGSWSCACSRDTNAVAKVTTEV